MGDATLMSNLCQHTKICWGEDVIKATDQMKDVHAAQDVLAKHTKDGSIMAAFERVGKEKVMYSYCQHTKIESQYDQLLRCSSDGLQPLFGSAEIACWVAESMQPFQIVKDQGFQSLMKTGRPDYYIPSPETVSCDVRNVFIYCWERITRMLQVSDK
jgi:hypothetical protein